MKRTYSFLLAVLLLVLFVIPASASSGTDNVPEGELALETITLGGKEITIPTIIQDMSLSPYCLQNNSSSVIYKQEITYCIPATEEALEYNDNFIRSTSPTTPRPTTDAFPFLNGYLLITTSIFYSYRPPQTGSPTPADFNYRLEAISIERNRDPGGVGTPIWGMDGNPVAIVRLGGAQEFGGSMIQENTYSLNWGKEKDVSSDFNMVVRSSASSGYAKFSFDIITDSGRENCECPHYFVV